ncbi:MAG TPA: TIGR01841 family phasin [Burkholderiaceae bacterium]|nr:TIGR01841 family phasin [Burkholderiaceae bacterium]
MATTLTELVELQKGQLDAWNALSQTLFDAAEKVVNLNIAAVKAAFHDSSESSQTLLGARDVQEFFTLANGVNQPNLEKAIGYSRNVYGIASGAGAELTKIFEAQVSEANRKIAELVDFAAKNSPTGSEPAVSLFKSAVAAANTVFDTASKAARQASDWAEANFAAAASATINAASAANDAAKGKSRKAA